MIIYENDKGGALPKRTGFQKMIIGINIYMPYKDPEKRREAVKNSKNKHRNKYLEIRRQKYKEFREKNPLPIREKQTIHEKKLKKSFADKKYYSDNINKITEYKKEYYKTNRYKIYDYYKTRRLTDNYYKLSTNLRSRFKSAVKREYKKSSTLSYLGCSIKEFKAYIETKFVENMSWDNYGVCGWHLDHIIPLYGFNLTIDDEIKKAFHYTNFQPLWAKDNLRKNKYCDKSC